MVDVIGELTVQERFGFCAAGFDQAKVGERDEDGLLAGRIKFGGGIAKVDNFRSFAVEDAVGRLQKAAPIRVHGGSSKGFGLLYRSF
jgi:hypothetical protein